MEKLPYHHQNSPRANGAAFRSRDCISTRFLRRVLATIIVCFALYGIVVYRSSAVYDGLSESYSNALMEAKISSSKVPLEAHIMSKCPDAQDCLQQLIVPAMEQVSDKVNFTLSFIAKVSNSSSGIECMHGPSECLGDMLILCAENLPFPPKRGGATVDGASFPPRTPVIRSLGFANCLIASYPRIPERELVETCALEHGVDFDDLNKCASEQDDDAGDGSDGTPLSGIALLRQSAIHSEAVGVTKSCTVRLDDAIWCVRDGAVWKDCAHDGEGSKVSVLVDEVERLWKKRN